MSANELDIDQLELDLSNPRISKAVDQREAMQRIIDDQDIKLANLAESIVVEGLNPMDRLLVVRSEAGNGKYTVLEGNRRVLALKILKNPSLLTGLDVRPSLQRRLETLAARFDPAAIEPVACFEVADRTESTTWIEQRHTGENEGQGIVNWSGLARARFRDRDPALQALDFVLQHGKLTDEQKTQITERFPITTLDRLLSTPDVRSKIGFETRGDKLLTALPAEEAIKPLKRIVLDLAEKKINVTQLKLKNQQVDYVSQLGEADAPDLSKKIGSPRAVEDISEGDFTPAAPPPRKSRAPRTPERKTIVPRPYSLRVTVPKSDAIYSELRSLRLSDHPHSISVMLRVFLETSVDHYLTQAGIPLRSPSGGGGYRDRSLNKKVEEAIEHMVSNGASRRDLNGVLRALGDKHHPLYVDLLNDYVHNRFYSPKERDLVVAWDNAQPFFERIWP